MMTVVEDLPGAKGEVDARGQFCFVTLCTFARSSRPSAFLYYTTCCHIFPPSLMAAQHLLESLHDCNLAAN